MAELQGLAFFPGLEQIKSANYTLSHGISPSVCVIKTVPQARLLAEIGTLRFTFGDVKLQFPQCAVDRASLRVNRSGQLWSLRVLDRRWKWRFGEITGRYNIRRTDGTIDPDSEKTPQELARLLLEAMGEQGFNVARMPNKTRPAVNWDHLVPAPLLASLCDQLSCRIVYDTTDKVTIYPIGDGRDLPENGLEMNAGFGLQTQLRPSKLRVVPSPVRFQVKLKLEAVGVEADGSIERIDDLSYKPANGWPSSNPDTGIFNNVLGFFLRDGKQTANSTLADQTVFKWYRVVGQADGKLTLPLFADVRIKSVDSYRLESVLVETSPDPDGVEKAKPAFVDGTFATPPPIVENVAAGTVWPFGLRIDARRQLVIFSEPCFQLDADGKPEEAEIFLTTTITVEDNRTRTPIRDHFEVDVQGARKGVGVRLLQHPEIVRNIRVIYDGINGVKVVDNKDAVNRESKHYTDAAEKEYETGEASDREYGGIVKINPDGKIQQVGWVVGPGGASTRASQNDEWSPFVPTYRQRRRAERVDAAVEKEAAISPDVLEAANRAFAAALGE